MHASGAFVFCTRVYVTRTSAGKNICLLHQSHSSGPLDKLLHRKENEEREQWGRQRPLRSLDSFVPTYPFAGTCAHPWGLKSLVAFKMARQSDFLADFIVLQLRQIFKLVFSQLIQILVKYCAFSSSLAAFCYTVMLFNRASVVM